MISRLFYLLLAGGMGGLLGWAIHDMLHLSDPNISVYQGYINTFFTGVIVGICIGGLIGLASGWAKGSMYQTWKGGILGALAGLIGGPVGIFLGSTVFALLGGTENQGGLGFTSFVWQLFARGFAWTVFGAGLGLAEGLAARSSKRAFQGAIGGAIGGFIGGFLFNIIGQLTVNFQYMLNPNNFSNGSGEIGIFSRAIGFTIMGGAIGFFIGLIEMIAKQAWVRVVLGRNEGKEFIVDTEVTSIGRAENSDIPLFGDMNVTPQHARIQKQGEVYTLVDNGTPQGTVLNGQRIQSSYLRDGDQIFIGSFNLVFHEKVGRDKVAVKDVQRSPQSKPIPIAPDACPFCGEKKNAMGACGCTVGAAPAPGMINEPTVVPQADSVVITAVDGPLAGKRFPISPSGITLGREATNEVAMTYDSTVSRLHARISIESGQLTIYDETSTNGTFVNGLQISRQPLKPGDTIRVGSTSFRVA